MYKIKINKSSVYVSIMQTLRENRWEPNTSKGGAPSYLGDADEGYLINKIEKRAIDMNCAKTIEVVRLAIEHWEKRFQKACQLIRLLFDVDHKCKSYDNLIENLIPYAPSCSWINYFIKTN